jgi:hypothetical protein
MSHYNKNGKPITYADLLSSGIAHNKKQAQDTLKRSLHRDIVFTLEKHKPQQYYPACLKSEIVSRKLSKNIPIGVTGVGFSNIPHFSINYSNNRDSNLCNESLVVIQSLEGYVLPLLPSAPLHIHKMQFKLKITPECYAELDDLRIDTGNKGKEHVEIICNVRVCYRFYANGTVVVFSETSNNPFKLEDDIDRSRLMVFFGQVRDRLVIFLTDTHEQIVPDIMEWELTQFDINRDVKVSDWLQYTGLKIQVKHLDHLFRIYVKSAGKDTVCRVEESVSSTKVSAAIDTINNIFNPYERIENQIKDLDKKLDKICSINRGEEKVRLQ